MVSMVMSVCAVLFPRGVLDENLNLIESVSEDFPSYSYYQILSGLYAPPSLVIRRKWLLHHQKVTRYSCNLNIGMEHKHTVQIILLNLIRGYAIFNSTFSNNLAILLAISDATADQTAPSKQSLHDKLFCRFKQTQKKTR